MTDLAGGDYPPVRIETPEGRAEYARAQRGFAERGQALRRRLLEAMEALEGHGGSGGLEASAGIGVPQTRRGLGG